MGARNGQGRKSLAKECQEGETILYTRPFGPVDDAISGERQMVIENHQAKVNEYDELFESGMKSSIRPELARHKRIHTHIQQAKHLAQVGGGAESRGRASTKVQFGNTDDTRDSTYHNGDDDDDSDAGADLDFAASGAVATLKEKKSFHMGSKKSSSKKKMSKKGTSKHEEG